MLCNNMQTQDENITIKRLHFSPLSFTLTDLSGFQTFLSTFSTKFSLAGFKGHICRL